MKVLIASDIHGNLEYTKKLDKLCEIEKFDKILLLGDLLNNYYTSESEDINEIVNILNKRAPITIGVRGNCDSEYDLDRLLFPSSNEIDEIVLDNTKFYLTHGHKNYKYDFLLDDHFCFLGHTHQYNLKGLHINPGSVGKPRMNGEHSCIIYNNKELLLINLDDFTVIEQRKIA